uniref:Peptidylprolyl isomerase (cyclophilin)-like 6 n=1 Tax=Cyprinus carpio TaxID=7962 RepID=A0A8C2EAR1_CYPCA
ILHRSWTGFWPWRSPPKQPRIVGLLNKHNFQIAKSIAEGLKNKFPESFDDPTIRPLLECDWHDYLSNKKRELKGEVWQYSGCLMSFTNGQLLGDERKLSSWAEKEWKFSFHRPQALYKALAEEYYTSNLRSKGHIFVYMDIESGGEAFGRMLFELFSDLCPKTCRNFKALCTGEAGLSKSNLELSYKGSIFHRVVPNGWLQGGDISPERRGTGGESIYGPTFEDENFVVSHNKRGILGMANQGAHSNGSQFYITLQPASWMDHKYVAFGQLVEGTEVLKRLEAVPTYNERPKQDCKISACGVFEP